MKRRIVSVLMALVMALSLLPVMAVAFYNHPRADDYTYGAVLRKVIDAGQGLPEAVAAIAAYVRSTYARWQGSFSAVVLFTLQPGVFSAPWRFLATMHSAVSASTSAPSGFWLA